MRIVPIHGVGGLLIPKSLCQIHGQLRMNDQKYGKIQLLQSKLYCVQDEP